MFLWTWIYTTPNCRASFKDFTGKEQETTSTLRWELNYPGSVYSQISFPQIVYISHAHYLSMIAYYSLVSHLIFVMSYFLVFLKYHLSYIYFNIILNTFIIFWALWLVLGWQKQMHFVLKCWEARSLTGKQINHLDTACHILYINRATVTTTIIPVVNA